MQFLPAASNAAGRNKNMVFFPYTLCAKSSEIQPSRFSW